MSYSRPECSLHGIMPTLFPPLCSAYHLQSEFFTLKFEYLDKIENRNMEEFQPVYQRTKRLRIKQEKKNGVENLVTHCSENQYLDFQAKQKSSTKSLALGWHSIPQTKLNFSCFSKQTFASSFGSKLVFSDKKTIQILLLIENSEKLYCEVACRESCPEATTLQL